jgi:hypothetical protein
MDWYRKGLDEQTDSHKRLEYFKKALEDAKNKIDHETEKAAAESAIRMIEESEKQENVVFKGSGVFKVVHQPSHIWWFVNPAFCTSMHEFRDTVGHQDWDIAWQPMLPYALWHPGFEIPNPPVLNKSREDNSYDDKIRAVSTVTGLNETVEVAAGNFGDCLKLETVVTSNDYKYAIGTVKSWFTPSVGLIKEQYFHSDGDETLTELTSFSVKMNPNFNLPFSVGNRWEYRGTRQSNPVVATHVFWVSYELKYDDPPDGYGWHIPYYTYATLKTDS